MVKSVIIKKTGGPSVLEYVTQEIREPKPGEVLIKHTVIGLNRYDVEHRSGIRKIHKLPHTLGVEAVGIIEKLGGDNGNFNVGDRVGYCTAPCGSYCEKRIIQDKYLFKIPNDIENEVVAAAAFKGMTAHYLTHRVYNIHPKTFALIHGSTGGLGQILCQWADHRKCKVIGTVSSDEKAEIALKNGCSYVLNYNSKSFVNDIMKITNNLGVNVVYDPIGLSTCRISFESLGLFGLFVSYSQLSGPVNNISLSMLSSRSLFVTSPSISHYKRSRLEMGLTAMELFEIIRKKHIKIKINKRYKFSEIKQAHQDIEDRKLSGFNVITV